MTQIGQAPQFQPNVIRDSFQQPQKQPAKPQEKPIAEEKTLSSGLQQQSNQNYQKLAQDILAKRAAGEAVQRSAVERGQVVNLLV